MMIKWILFILTLSSGTSFGQSILNDTEFSDGKVFVSSESYDWSWTYKFGINDYKIYLYYHYESPETYLIEEGSYLITKKEVVLTPRTRLICEIEGLARFDCMTALGPAEGFYVSRDSLSEKEIVALSFTNRVCLISKEDDKLKFKDPSKRFIGFSQRKKE